RPSVAAGSDAIAVDGAQGEHEDRDLVILEAEITEVFAGHGRRVLDDLLLAEGPLNGRDHARSERRIVVHRRCGRGFAGLAGRHAVLRDTAGNGDTASDALERSDDLGPDLLFVRADAQL